MSSQLIPFTYEGSSVRVIQGGDGEPWFVAADVARALGYSSAKDFVRGIEDEDKGGQIVPTPSGDQEMTVISEPGLYGALVRSRAERVKPFRRWVTHEVLPSIRRHGAYATPATVEAMLADPDTMIATLNALKAEREAKEVAQQQVQELTPKARQFDNFLSSVGDYSVTEAAQILCRAGAKTGRNRLHNTLADIGWLYKPKGHRRWRAYQTAVDAGRIRLRPTTWRDQETGEEHPAHTVRITPKGLDALAHHFNVIVPKEIEA